MVSTRLNGAGNSSTTAPASAEETAAVLPRYEQQLINPTRGENWLTKPTSEEEFGSWMRQTEEMLLRWLKEAKDRAQNEQTAEEISDFNQRALEEWTTFEAQTDVQTGTIWREDDQEQMEHRMQVLNEERKAIHKDHATYSRSVEYSAAQAAWEDFLYYRNVWNRRNVQYLVPLLGKQSQGTTASDQASVSQDSKVAKKAKDPVRGTAGQDNITRFGDRPRGNFGNYWAKWSKNVVETFRDFDLGYRKKAPRFIEPEHAHQYSQPPRVAAPPKSKVSGKRHLHFEERYPRKKLEIIRVPENEEGFRRFEIPPRTSPLVHKKKDLTAIEWDIDESTIEEHMRAKEAENQHERHPDVGLHQACLEKSSDIQTSFESPLWGHTVSRTCMLREAVEDVEIAHDSPKQNDGDADSNKKDAPNDETAHRTESTRKPRYKSQIVRKRPRNYDFERRVDGDVKRPKKGQYQGKWTDEDEEDDCVEFELDDDGERIEEEDEPEYRMSYRTIITTDHPRTTRKSRHENANVLDQLSDDSEWESTDGSVDGGSDKEDETGEDQEYSSDEPGSRNGGGPGTSGKPGGEGGKGGKGGKKGGGGGGGGEDDDADPEDPYDGDLFRKAYEED